MMRPPNGKPEFDPKKNWKKPLSGAKEILDDLPIIVRVILPNEAKALYCLQSVSHFYVAVGCVTKNEKKRGLIE